MEKIFICSPYREDVKKNIENVKRYCNYFSYEGIPIAPLEAIDNVAKAYQDLAVVLFAVADNTIGVLPGQAMKIDFLEVRKIIHRKSLLQSVLSH